MRPPTPIPNAIPAEPDEFVKSIIAVFQRGYLRQERCRGECQVSVFGGRERKHRVARRSEGPQRSRHVPRVSHDKRRRNPSLAQDFRRKRRVLEGVARPILAPPHRNIKILCERLAHQRRQRRLGMVRRAAAHEYRQPEPTLLSRRLCKALKGERSDRFGLAVAVSSIGGEYDDSTG